MSLNYVLPNGVTMGFGSEAERDAFLASQAGAGAQTQEAAMAANPGQSMEQIKNQNYQQHYSPQGAGYGLVPQSERDFGGNVEKNKWIAQQTGYGGNFGGQYTNNFGTWASERGIDTGALEQQWAQQQNRPQAEPYSASGGAWGQPSPGGMNAGMSWASLPGMQGLLGGLTNALNSVSSQQQQPMWQQPTTNGWGGWGGSSAPSGGGFPGTANSGHNMLWSW